MNESEIKSNAIGLSILFKVGAFSDSIRAKNTVGRDRMVPNPIMPQKD